MYLPTTGRKTLDAPGEKARIYLRTCWRVTRDVKPALW